MDKCYSTNGEEFNYTEVADVLDAMDNDGNLVEGAVYYESDSEQVHLDRYLRAAVILEHAEEALCDDVGDAGEDAFFASNEARQELDDFLNEWSKKHLAGTYWMCVGKTREIKVTTRDVAEYAA